jgi:hypothetical protein
MASRSSHPSSSLREIFHFGRLCSLKSVSEEEGSQMIADERRLTHDRAAPKKHESDQKTIRQSGVVMVEKAQHTVALQILDYPGPCELMPMARPVRTVDRIL